MEREETIWISLRLKGGVNASEHSVQGHPASPVPVAVDLPDSSSTAASGVSQDAPPTSPTLAHQSCSGSKSSQDNSVLQTPPAIAMPAAGKEAAVSADEEAASPPTDVSDECRNDAELAAALRQSDQETQVAVALSKQERKELPMCANGCGRVAAEKSRYGTCCRTCRKKSLVHGPECNKNFFGDVDPPPEYVLKKNHWMPKEGEDVKLCLNGCGRRVPQYNRSNRYCCTTCGPFHRRHGDWCNSNHFGEGQPIPKECDMLLLDKMVRMCNQGCGRPAQQVAGYKRCCRSCSFKGRCLEHSEECLGPAENVVVNLQRGPPKATVPEAPTAALPTGSTDQPTPGSTTAAASSGDPMKKEGVQPVPSLCAKGCGRGVPGWGKGLRCCRTCHHSHERHGNRCNYRVFGDGWIPPENIPSWDDEPTPLCDQGCGRTAKLYTGKSKRFPGTGDKRGRQWYARCCKSCDKSTEGDYHDATCTGPDWDAPKPVVPNDNNDEDSTDKDKSDHPPDSSPDGTGKGVKRSSQEDLNPGVLKLSKADSSEQQTKGKCLDLRPAKQNTRPRGAASLTPRLLGCPDGVILRPAPLEPVIGQEDRLGNGDGFGLSRPTKCIGDLPKNPEEEKYRQVFVKEPRRVCVEAAEKMDSEGGHPSTNDPEDQDDARSESALDPTHAARVHADVGRDCAVRAAYPVCNASCHAEQADECMDEAQDFALPPKAESTLSDPRMAALSSLPFWGDQPGSTEFWDAQRRELEFLNAVHDARGKPTTDSACERIMRAHAERPKATSSTYQIIVKASVNGEVRTEVLEVYVGMTVLELKALIKDAHGIPMELQRLVHNARTLSDDDRVDCIDKEEVVTVALALSGGAPKGIRWCYLSPCENGCHMYANPERPDLKTCCGACWSKNLHTAECVGRQVQIHEEMLRKDFEDDARAEERWRKGQQAKWEPRTCNRQCALNDRDGRCKRWCSLASYHDGPHVCDVCRNFPSPSATVNRSVARAGTEVMVCSGARGSQDYWKTKNTIMDADTEAAELAHQVRILHRQPPPYPPDPCTNLGRVDLGSAKQYPKTCPD